jgi:hypothetical protein
MPNNRISKSIIVTPATDREQLDNVIKKTERLDADIESKRSIHYQNRR